MIWHVAHHTWHHVTNSTAHEKQTTCRLFKSFVLKNKNAMTWTYQLPIWSSTFLTAILKLPANGTYPLQVWRYSSWWFLCCFFHVQLGNGDCGRGLQGILGDFLSKRDNSNFLIRITSIYLVSARLSGTLYILN